MGEEALVDFSVNWAAVVVSGIVYFLLGWLWYSQVLFGKAWMAASGIDMTKAPADKGNMLRSYGLSLLAGIVMAAALALVLRAAHAEGIGAGIAWALVAGIGFVAMAIGMMSLFPQKSPKLLAINVGYPVVGYVVMSIVLTVWR